MLSSPAKPRRTAALTMNISALAGKIYVPFLRRYVRQAFDLLKSQNARLPLRELSVALVGSRRMAELHDQFLSVQGPTDVLTFPIDTDPRGRTLAGEVVICVPIARASARLRNIEPKLELLLYAIHGLLHLCGYDDRTDRDFHRMHRTEDWILTELGLGPVFARSSHSRSNGRRR